MKRLTGVFMVTVALFSAAGMSADKAVTGCLLGAAAGGVVGKATH
ncbi:hypothetical protein [Enterobacter sp. Lyrl_3]